MNECQQFDTVNLFKLHFSSAVAHFVLQRDVFGTCTIGSVEKIAFASFWLVFFQHFFVPKWKNTPTKYHRKNIESRPDVSFACKFVLKSVLFHFVRYQYFRSFNFEFSNKKKLLLSEQKRFFHRNALQSQWTLDIYSMYGVDYTAKSFYDRPVYMCAFNSHFFFQLAFVQSKTHSHTNSNFSTDSNHYRA